MTTNIDRAVEVMRSFWHDGRYAVGFDEIADALADAGLLAAECECPALDEAHAAVAEAIRLRQAIASMRDRHLARIAAADYITAGLMNDQFIADDLTRILEGGTR